MMNLFPCLFQGHAHIYMLVLDDSILERSRVCDIKLLPIAP